MLEGLALTENSIIKCALAAIWKSRHVLQSIDFSEAKWKYDDAKHKDENFP